MKTTPAQFDHHSTRSHVRAIGRLARAPAVIAMALSVVAWPAHAEVALKIATWNVSKAERHIAKTKPKLTTPGWRHTFGSERHERTPSKPGEFNLDIDIVLLQGVTNASVMRQIFPPRRWKLILSRDFSQQQISLSRLPADLMSYDISGYEYSVKMPVTAVAIRYKRRLRVRGIQHIYPDNPDINADVERERFDLAVPKTPVPTSATAVLINYFGASVWVVSARNPGTCPKLDETCAPIQTIASWYRSDRPAKKRTMPIIIGITDSANRDQSSDAADQTQPCGRLTQWQMPRHTYSRPDNPDSRPQAWLSRLKQRNKPELGCIMRARLSMPRPLPPQQPLSPPDSIGISSP